MRKNLNIKKLRNEELERNLFFFKNFLKKDKFFENLSI